METAVSNIIRTICTVINDKIIYLDALLILFPSSLINKCPAIILAVKRTASDPGRIKLLIVSMHTINGISTAGVPAGIKCLNICSVLFVHPKIINLIHSGNAIVNVNVKCLDLVNTYGNNPIILLNRININKVTNKSVNPLFSLRINLNSLCIVIIIFLTTKLYREGVIQYIVGIIIIPRSVLVQFNDILILLAGSKVENKFVIIFRYCF
jgi:hypothetical protein